MYRIRRYENAPPGQYYYKLLFQNGKEEPYQGLCKHTANCHQFGPSPTINEPARRLSAFRTANNLPRATLTEATEDVDTFTCNRLGNSSTWCYDTDKPYAEVNPSAKPAAPCSTCGHQLT